MQAFFVFVTDRNVGCYESPLRDSEGCERLFARSDRLWWM